MAEKLVVLALGMESLELKTTTASLVSSLHEIMARAAETKRDLKKVQETFA